ncbi:O-antigen ligase family protein [Lysinibacillus sp. NPDC097214]|uniref:O-antigen ligase family protein n=1 Tax=Lysinibacillus sp. NPDC097214 TaxID=3390584 RepID=UPI003D03E407
MKKNTLNLNIKPLLYIIIVYPFYKPYYFSEIGIMPIVNQILFAVALVIIALFYFVKLPRIYINSGVCFIIFYYLFILVSTFLNNSFNSNYFSLVSFSIGFGLLVNHCLKNKNEFLYFLSAIYFLLYVYLLANLLAMILYPNGIPSITYYIDLPQYVFGNTNSVIKVVLPGLCFAFLYDSLKYKRIRSKSWILLLLVWITLLNTASITSVMGCFVFTIFVIFKRMGNMKSLVNYFTMFIISFVLFMMVVVLKYENNFLGNILSIFGKTLTFSNRDVLWINAINSIKSSPIWGYGIQNPEIIWEHIGNKHGSHNYYLDTLYRGGLVALLFLISGVIYFGKKIVKYKNNIVIRTIIGTCCAYFVMWIFEPFISTEYLMFSIFFVLTSRIDVIVSYFYDA